jgi:hypothetical protein
MTDNAGLIDLRDDGPRTLPEEDAAPLARFLDRIVVSTHGEWFGATDDALYRLRVTPPGVLRRHAGAPSQAAVNAGRQPASPD